MLFRSKVAGFTLIEMLVALAVVAIALAAISSNYISSFDITDSLKERTIARWVAENHLVMRQVQTPWPALGTREGTLKYAGSEWSWEEAVKPTPDQDFRRISIDVRRKESTWTAASLVAYARNPTPSAPGGGK